MRVFQPGIRNSDVRVDDGACWWEVQDNPWGGASLQLWFLGPDDSSDRLPGASLETPPAPLLSPAGGPHPGLLVSPGVIQVRQVLWLYGLYGKADSAPPPPKKSHFCPAVK